MASLQLVPSLVLNLSPFGGNLVSTWLAVYLDFHPFPGEDAPALDWVCSGWVWHELSGLHLVGELPWVDLRSV